MMSMTAVRDSTKVRPSKAVSTPAAIAKNRTASSCRASRYINGISAVPKSAGMKRQPKELNQKSLMPLKVTSWEWGAGGEVVLPEEVLVRVIGKVQLVEHEGRVGRDVVWLAQPGDRWILVVVPDPPGADRRRRAGVGEDVEEKWAGEAKKSRDQGERDQPVEVGPVDAPPCGARGSAGGGGAGRRGW